MSKCYNIRRAFERKVAVNEKEIVVSEGYEFEFDDTDEVSNYEFEEAGEELLDELLDNPNVGEDEIDYLRNILYNEPELFLDEVKAIIEDYDRVFDDILYKYD